MQPSIRGFGMASGVGGGGSGVGTRAGLVVDQTPDTRPLTPSFRARPQTMAGLAWWRFARHRMAVAGLLVVAGPRPPPAPAPPALPHGACQPPPQDPPPPTPPVPPPGHPD